MTPSTIFTIASTLLLSSYSDHPLSIVYIRKYFHTFTCHLINLWLMRVSCLFELDSICQSQERLAQIMDMYLDNEIIIFHWRMIARSKP